MEKEKGEWQKAMENQFPIIEHWYTHSPRVAREDTLAVLFPRLAGQPAPKVTPILGGKSFIIEHRSGRGFVFASVVSVVYKEDGVDFVGKYAVVWGRAGQATLTLLEGERLAYKGKVLTAKGNEGFWEGTDLPRLTTGGITDARDHCRSHAHGR